MRRKTDTQITLHDEMCSLRMENYAAGKKLFNRNSLLSVIKDPLETVIMREWADVHR